jgi:hypothetical protein
MFLHESGALNRSMLRFGACFDLQIKHTGVFNKQDLCWLSSGRGHGMVCEKKVVVVMSSIISSDKGFQFSYTIQERARVTIKLFSMAGTCIATIRDEEHSPGPQQVQWDGIGKDGRQVPGGSYLAVCAIGSKVITRKIILVK